MRNRLLSLALALIYLGVSLAFSDGHVHDGAKGLAHQCAACAWHSEANAEPASAPMLVRAPEIFLVSENPAESRIFTRVPVLRADRGPPRIS